MLAFVLTTLAVAPNPELLVSAQWLAGNRLSPNVVVLHVARERTDYERGHIPGARFLPARALWVTTGPGVELPSPAQIDSVFESVGVSNNSRVVLYGDTWTTPRAFLALDYIGLGDRAALLNGGLADWTAAGHATETGTGPSSIPNGTITPTANPAIVADADWIKTRLNDPSVALIDGRTKAEYDGTTDVERLPRFGHIPGALNLPWTDTFTAPAAADSGRATALIDLPALSAMFVKAGGGEGKQIVTYCTVGLRASHLYFVARLLGHRPKIYDGSMRDWSAVPALPMVGPAPTPPAQEKPRPFLSSIDWLHHHGSDANVVVLHVDRNRASYDSAHVEGARFVPMSAFVTERHGLPTELPEPKQLDSLLESVGIGDATRHIVLTGDVLAASRLFFTLDYLGLADRATWLDGGVQAWREGGHPVTSHSPTVTPGALSMTARPELVATAEDVVRLLQDSTVVVIDARKPEEFAGTAKEEGVDRPGHIPGSVNIDWTTLWAGRRLRPAVELEAIFRAAGATPGKAIVTLCRVGTRASALYLAARSAGYRTLMYDGSMIDWSRRPDLPVATGHSSGPGRSK